MLAIDDPAYSWRYMHADVFDQDSYSLLERIINKHNSLPLVFSRGQSNETDLKRILSERDLTNESLKLSIQISSSDFIPSDFGDPDIDSTFPEHRAGPEFKRAIATLSALTDVDYTWALENFFDHGLTGTQPFLLYSSVTDDVSHGSIRHDNTSAIDNLILRKFPTLVDFEGVSFNKALYGSSSVQVSALLMAMHEYYNSKVLGAIPESIEFPDFIGRTEEEIIQRLQQDIPFFSPITNFGAMTASIGSQLAYYTGDQSTAELLLKETFAETLLGYIGDRVAFEISGVSLPVSNIYSLTLGNVTSNIAASATRGVAALFNSAFKIDDPLGQFISSTIATGLMNTAISDYVIDGLSFAFESDMARLSFGVEALGLDPNANLTFAPELVAGEIVRVFGEGFDDFLLGQLFAHLDAEWESVDLDNIGSMLGGIIGGFIAPGVGQFVGQVAGGFVFDVAFGKDPRSFHTVALNQDQKTIDVTFSFQADGGQIEISEELAETASNVLELIVLASGGTPIEMQAYDYGHYEDRFTFDFGHGRFEFESAEKLLDYAVLSQARTIEFSGGDPYVIGLLNKADYNPTLQELIHDMGVAQQYGIHKNDPEFFAGLILGIDEADSKERILGDWALNLEKSRELGLRDFSFNDGSEFIIQDNRVMYAGGGNDVIYSKLSGSTVSGEQGDDLVIASVQVLDGRSSTFSGGVGYDKFSADFSAFSLSPDISGTAGVYVSTVNQRWRISHQFPTNTSVNLSEFEVFDIIGTNFNDFFQLRNGTSSFDGRDGYDRVEVLLSAAVDAIEIDATSESNQVLYKSANVRNIEGFQYVETGSGDDILKLHGEYPTVNSGDGNDRIYVDHSILLAQSSTSQIAAGSGDDTLIADFSAFSLSPDISGTAGVYVSSVNQRWRIAHQFPTNTSVNLSEFEVFDIAGTDFDDFFQLRNGTSTFDGRDGYDRVEVLLSAAVDAIEIDATSESNQVLYKSANVKNIEGFQYVETGSGDDILKLHGEYPTVNSGGGNDRIYVDHGILLTQSSKSQIDAGSGIDTLIANFSAFSLSPDVYGSDGVFVSTANQRWRIAHQTWSNNSVYLSNVEAFDIVGTDFGDFFQLRDGASSFDGRDGYDRVEVLLSAAVDAIEIDSTAESNQVLYKNANIKNVEFFARIETGSGDDTVRALGKFQSIDTGSGDDVLYLDHQTLYWDNLSIDLGEGVNSVHLDFSAYRGSDQLGYEQGLHIYHPTSANRYIYAGDLVWRKYQIKNVESFTVFGTTLRDKITGGSSSDHISGGSGNDYLNGLGGSDLILGGNGDDRIFGGSSPDQLFGGLGSDLMDGGEHSDIFFVDSFDTVTDTGVAGYDKAQINDPVGVTVSLAGWSGVERVNGYTGNDTIDGSTQSQNILLFGDNGNDTLTGGLGDDVVIGGAGDDVLIGNDGRDILLGNSGNDSFDGGAGNDVFFISDAGDVVTDGGEGFDKAVVTVTTGITLNVGSWQGVERINGLTGDDVIDGTGLTTSTIFVGSGGNDTLTGGSAGDVFYGGADNDILIGAGGNDALIGSVGDDKINGGAGRDFYLGGTGSDAFVWSDGFDQDVVKDFQDGTDRLDFTGHSTVNSIADLNISQSGNHTIITLAAGGTDKITLADTLATLVTSADIDFV